MKEQRVGNATDWVPFLMMELDCLTHAEVDLEVT